MLNLGRHSFYYLIKFVKARLHEDDLAKQEREIIESLEREEREKTGSGNIHSRDILLRFIKNFFGKQGP